MQSTKYYREQAGRALQLATQMTLPDVIETLERLARDDEDTAAAG